MRAQAVELRVEGVEMRKVTNPNRAPSNLVLISRTDTTSGGTDLARTSGSFAQTIQITMYRQD